LARVEELHEQNPMLGLRGCRLGITFPEITEMQARAIIEAAVVVKSKGGDPHPEIMVPLIGSIEEMRNQSAIIRRVADEVFAEKKIKVDYMVGTMIELPRAALNFLPAYLKLGIFKQDPFATLDQVGVGQLVKGAVAKGRNTRPKLKVGICGEHGGDPESVKFCHKIDLNYVSCSPFRLLTARLAAAQAALEEKLGVQGGSK
jgi:pyruvate,orthophosphate dikinase